MIYAGVSNSVIHFICALAVILIMFSAIKLFSELAQVLYGLREPCKNPKYWWLYFNYFSDLSNWLGLPLYILTIFFASIQFNSECTCVHSWQWSIGIASLFLAWASLILFLRKLELFGMIINLSWFTNLNLLNSTTDTGVYVLMLEILLKQFLKTIILTSFLVVMFAITFYLTFNQIQPSFVRSPFSSVYNSLWKVMTMVTGEMDYESIFPVFQWNARSRSPTVFPRNIMCCGLCSSL